MKNNANVPKLEKKKRMNRRNRVNRQRRAEAEKNVLERKLAACEVQLTYQANKHKDASSYPCRVPANGKNSTRFVQNKHVVAWKDKSSSFRPHRLISTCSKGLASRDIKNSHESSRKKAQIAIGRTLVTLPLSINPRVLDYGTSALPQWSGAYGKVFIAKCSLLASDNHVAIKKVKSGNILNEARVLLNLQGGHGSIPYLYGMISNDSLVMELISVDDCSMNRHLKGSPTTFSDSQWIRLCADIADGLAYIHGKGIIHNDLHGNNVLIARPRSTVCPKIIDFGSATLVASPRTYHLNNEEKKDYSRKHSHIAWELRMLDGQSQSCLSDVYSFGRLIKSVTLLCHIPHLGPISAACRDHTVARRPSAKFVSNQIRALLTHQGRQGKN